MRTRLKNMGMLFLSQVKKGAVSLNNPDEKSWRPDQTKRDERLKKGKGYIY